MKTKVYLLTIITLLCISCKEKKADAIQTEENVSPIDTAIQKVAENALYNQLEELNADAGITIVMETETGIIKAVANNNFSENDSIETASLFKIPCMIAALEDNVISSIDEIDTENGILEYESITINDYNANMGSYGKITAEQVIMFSSNVGMAKIILKGYESNPNKLVEGLHELGFTNILKDKPIADYLSLGHGIKVPVIQILEFYNSIANGTVKCSPTTLDAIRKMLANTVNDNTGTGYLAKSDKVLIAGKTGSAKNSALFCGYFPADNPKYSCIVIIDNPKNGYLSGGVMAGTVFKEIAEKINEQ